jgi:hypothetical protein
MGKSNALSMATCDIDEMITAGNAHVNTYFSAIEIKAAGIGRTVEMSHPKKKAVITMPITPRNYFPTTVPPRKYDTSRCGKMTIWAQS